MISRALRLLPGPPALRAALLVAATAAALALLWLGYESLGSLLDSGGAIG